MLALLALCSALTGPAQMECKTKYTACAIWVSGQTQVSVELAAKGLATYPENREKICPMFEVAQ